MGISLSIHANASNDNVTETETNHYKSSESEKTNSHFKEIRIFVEEIQKWQTSYILSLIHI